MLNLHYPLRQTGFGLSLGSIGPLRLSSLPVTASTLSTRTPQLTVPSSATSLTPFQQRNDGGREPTLVPEGDRCRAAARHAAEQPLQPWW